jgi:hypothetical protein
MSDRRGGRGPSGGSVGEGPRPRRAGGEGGKGVTRGPPQAARLRTLRWRAGAIARGRGCRGRSRETRATGASAPTQLCRSCTQYPQVPATPTGALFPASPTRPVQDQHPARRPTAPLLNRPAGASVNQIHPVNSPHPLLLPTLRTGCDQRLHRLQSISAQGFDLSRQGRAQHLTFSRPRRLLHSFARGSSRIDPRSNQAFAH